MKNQETTTTEKTTLSIATQAKDIVKAAENGLAFTDIEQCKNTRVLLQAARLLLNSEHMLEAHACLEKLNYIALLQTPKAPPLLSEEAYQKTKKTAESHILNGNAPMGALFLAYIFLHQSPQTNENNNEDQLIQYETIRQRALSQLYQQTNPSKQHLTHEEKNTIQQLETQAKESLKLVDDDRLIATCKSALTLLEEQLKTPSVSGSLFNECIEKSTHFTGLLQQAANRWYTGLLLALSHGQYSAALELCLDASKSINLVSKQFSSYKLATDIMQFYEQQIAILNSHITDLSTLKTYGHNASNAQKFYLEKRYKSCQFLCKTILATMQGAKYLTNLGAENHNLLAQKTVKLEKAAQLKPRVDKVAKTLNDCATNQEFNTYKTKKQKAICTQMLIKIVESLDNIDQQIDHFELTHYHYEIATPWIERLDATLEKSLKLKLYMAKAFFKLEDNELCLSECTRAIDTINTTLNAICDPDHFPPLSQLQQKLAQPFLALQQKASSDNLNKSTKHVGFSNSSSTLYYSPSRAPSINTQAHREQARANGKPANKRQLPNNFPSI